MPKTITLLGGPARTAPDGKVGLLFECAPDDQIAKRYPESAKLTELIGEFDATKEHAHALASKLLEGEPPFQGVRQLSIFDEQVIGEVQRILHAKALHDWLASHDIDTCVFTHPSRLAHDLRWISQRSGNAISVTAPHAEDSAPASAVRRSCGRIRATRFNRASIASEWRLLLDRVDPFHSRTRLVRKGLHSRRRLWFYSTAYTFSRIGLAYEPYFPEPFDYLVENPQTGGVPLAAVGRSFSSPYDFATREMAPTRRGVIAARETIQQHIGTVQLSAEEGLVRDAYLNGSGLATFMSRLLPLGLFQTQLFQRFVEVTEPAALIVGNPVFEGYALHAAQRAGVPTFLLQHGILGDFCQFVDPPADHYVVRGEFWREFLSPKARRRALVLNPPENPVAAGSIQKPKRAVVFLTAPYGQQELWDESDLDSILLTVLAACRHGKADLIIRVHPMERIETYVSTLRRLACQGREDVSVSYSQGPKLDHILERSAVAVTFSSTVFLDCLRHRLPIISFGWHDFSYRRQIAEHGVFHFCRDLTDLFGLIQRALHGDLPEFAASVAPFLANTSEFEIKEALRRVLSSGPAAG